MYERFDKVFEQITHIKRDDNSCCIICRQLDRSAEESMEVKVLRDETGTCVPQNPKPLSKNPKSNTKRASKESKNHIQKKRQSIHDLFVHLETCEPFYHPSEWQD